MNANLVQVDFIKYLVCWNILDLKCDYHDKGDCQTNHPEQDKVHRAQKGLARVHRVLQNQGSGHLAHKD